MSSEYNPSANLSFDFNCQYIPPAGEVNFDFPDMRCADFGVILFEEGAYGNADLADSNSYDAWSCETLLIDLATFKFLEANGFSGERGHLDNISISRNFDAHAHEGSTLEQVPLLIPPVAFLQPRFFAGGKCYVGLATLLAPWARDGETNSFELDTHPSFDLGFILPNAGELLLSDVYKWTTVPHDYFGGEYSTTEIEINLPDLIDSSNFSGEYSEAGIFVTPHFWHDQYAGETSLTSLITFPPVDLSTASARAGQTLESIGLFTYRLFNHTQYAGELVQFDLDYIKNEGSPSDSYSGETSDATLATQDALPFVGHGGEYAEADVSTEYAFELFAYHGQRNTFDLQPRAPIIITADGRSGEFGFIPFINYSTVFTALAYSGAICSVTFTTYPSPELLFLSYAGEFSETSMQVSQQIGQFNAFDGQRGEVTELASLENYKFITGENGRIDLNTEVILGFDVCTGDNTRIDLIAKPSEGVGKLQPSSGEAMVCDALKIIQHHDLYIVFWHDTRIQIDIDSQTYFDLTTDSCCSSPRVLQAQNIRIELDFAEYPDQVHFGDRVVFQADLSCRPRFNIVAYGGELTDIIDKTDYIAEDSDGTPQMYFRSGEAFALVSFEAIFVHRLCKGFFIPSGNNIQIELTDVLNENCYVDRAYAGETMAVVISNTKLMPNNQYFGGRLLFNLEVPKPWVLNFYPGEKMLFDLATTIRQGGLARDGSNMFIKFYEPDWVGSDGQVVLVDIEFDVQVEFIDAGCLENEYIYMNEDGDPIPEKFEPVPIELYPYQHDIKARCF